MRISEKLQPLSLLALRLALGVIFFYHGYEKLTHHSNDALAAFTGLGLPTYVFDVVSTLELFGAILLALGLLTRFTALLLAIEMGLVLARVDLPRGGIYAVQNYELALALCAGAFALVTTGAGLLSVDAATFERAGGKGRPKPKGS
jgi:putative oxidoreductase